MKGRFYGALNSEAVFAGEEFALIPFLNTSNALLLPAQTKRWEWKDPEEESENPVDCFLEVLILLFIPLVKMLKQAMIDLRLGWIWTDELRITGSRV